MSSQPPGYIPITSQSLPPGAGTPQDAAIANMKANAATAQQIKNLAGGKMHRRRGTKRRTKRRGGGVAAPQFQPRYNETAGNGTGTNDQIATLTQNNMQAVENSRMDAAATSLKGGKRHRHRHRRRTQKSKRKTHRKSSHKRRLH